MKNLIIAISSLLLATTALAGPKAKAPAAAKPAEATSCEGPSAAAPAADKKNPCHHPENDGAAAAKSTSDILVRGDKMKGAPAVTLSELLSAPQKHDGKTVQVEGKVRKACSTKGCWMELAGTEKGPGVRVTFMNYGFFVPLDSAGSSAKVEGQVALKELSEDTAKHYEGEGAIVPRGADGKAREVQLVASSVELRR